MQGLKRPRAGQNESDRVGRNDESSAALHAVNNTVGELIRRIKLTQSFKRYSECTYKKRKKATIMHLTFFLNAFRQTKMF